MLILYTVTSYNRVPHQRLLKVLRFYNTAGNLVKWMEDFLSECKQRLAVNNVLLKRHDVISGLPQGSALGLV